MRGRRQAWRHDDRGVAIVEAAIVVPVFLLLVIGVIEFGLVFKDQLAVTSAVRAGARLVSSEPRTATFATDGAAQVAREAGALDLRGVTDMWVYKADATGHPLGAGGTFDACTTSCLTFTWNSAAQSFVQSGGSWSASSQDACAGEEDSVGIYLKYRHDSVTNLFFSSLGLTSHTVMRLEPIPALQSGGCK